MIATIQSAYRYVIRLDGGLSNPWYLLRTDDSESPALSNFFLKDDIKATKEMIEEMKEQGAKKVEVVATRKIPDVKRHIPGWNGKQARTIVSSVMG